MSEGMPTPRRYAAILAVSAGTALVAIAWCVGLALVGYLWSRKLYSRDLAR